MYMVLLVLVNMCSAKSGGNWWKQDMTIEKGPVQA